MRKNCQKNCEENNKKFLQFFILACNEKLNNMFCKNIKAAVIKRYKNN